MKKTNIIIQETDLTIYERELSTAGYALIGGTDEVGRGSLAGPVVACVVVLPPLFNHPEINDSKKTAPKKRLLLSDIIKKHAVSYAIAEVCQITIDEINILEATRLAMKNAYLSLGIKPNYLLTDAVELPDIPVPQTAVTGGDAKSISIAAASIVAKVYRDSIMIHAHDEYPQYGFHTNKGYGTAAHIAALKEFGPCPLHRKSFIGKFTQSIGNE